jgi:hypothetical protein
MLNQTTKTFPRNVEKNPVIEGPFHKKPSEFGILLAIIFVIGLVAVMCDLFIWRS